MCISGCPNLTFDAYCEEHAALRRKQYDKYSRSPNHDKKYGNNCKRIRGLYAKKHPLCESCMEEGRITPVEEVHHIIPLSRGATNQFSNLMSLCQSCHTKIHYELGDRKQWQEVEISTTKNKKTEPGVSCAKIEVQKGG